jgi:hypothetical protein
MYIIHDGYKFLTAIKGLVRASLSCAHCMFPCPCRIAVFSVTVLHDERIVIVAEQRPDSTEEDSFQWMSRVLQVVPHCLDACLISASLSHCRLHFRLSGDVFAKQCSFPCST